MKIVICASMSVAKKVMEIERELREQGHEIFIPRNIDKYASGILNMENSYESAQNKIEGDLIRDYYKKIKSHDAVLIVNENKNGIKNYIGGNTFLEIGFSHVLNKKIFILNDIPEIAYKDEIIAMKPIVLRGNLTKIK